MGESDGLGEEGRAVLRGFLDTFRCTCPHELHTRTMSDGLITVECNLCGFHPYAKQERQMREDKRDD